MSTFAELKGKQPVNWNAFLDRETHGSIEIKNARTFSSSWITCACGNQCDCIPRKADGEPEDLLLQLLGFEFNWAIQSMSADSRVYNMTYIQKAKDILKKIEARSAVLINQIQSEKNIC